MLLQSLRSLVQTDLVVILVTELQSSNDDEQLPAGPQHKHVRYEKGLFIRLYFPTEEWLELRLVGSRFGGETSWMGRQAARGRRYATESLPADRWYHSIKAVGLNFLKLLADSLFKSSLKVT